MHNHYSDCSNDGAMLGFATSSTLRLGDVSFNVLLDAIAHFNLLHIPKRCSKHFAWYVSVPGQKIFADCNHRKDILVLCHDEFAESFLDANLDAFCIVLTDEEQTPSWVELKNRRNRVVVIKQSERFYFYDSILQSLFVNNLVWENEMDRVVYSKGRLDRLIALSEDMLGNFICITDTGYNLIAYSRGIEPPDANYAYLVNNNCYEEYEINAIEKEILKKVEKRNQLILCEPNEIHHFPVLHYPVFVDGAYLFHIALACQYGSLQALQDLFLKFMRRVVLLCNEFWKTTVNLESSWHRVLQGIIEGEPMTEDYINTQLAQTAIPAAKQFRLLCFQFSSAMSLQERSCVVSVAEKLNGGFCYPFMLNDDLLVLLYSDSENEAALSGKKVYNDVETCIYRTYGVAAGASQVFLQIENLKRAYSQANIACAMRAPLRREYETLHGISDVPCYAFEHVLKFYVLLEGHDADLVESAFDHSVLQKIVDEDCAAGTEIAKLIWVYLNSGRNATETAKAIHVHRNTVLYHITRLERRFDISFESPLLRSRMLLDFHRLFLEGAI